VNNQQESAEATTLPLRSALFAAFLCMLFGANAVAIKISLAGIGIFTVAGLRFGGSALVLACYAKAAGLPLALNRRQWRLLAPLTVIFFSQLCLFYQGVSRTTATHATLIANLLPFVVMILAHFFIAGDRITRRTLLGLILGFGGVVVLLLDHDTMSGSAWIGDALLLLAVLLWGVNAIYTKRIVDHFSPVQMILHLALFSAPFFLICGFFWDTFMFGTVDWWVGGALFYQVFATASFGFVAWVTMLRRYGATALHAFIFIMPVSGVFFGIVLLGEPLTVNLVGAMILVTAGLIVVNRRPAAMMPAPDVVAGDTTDNTSDK
jgi:drug/metabolite transporter (DMT)-like permease